MSLVSSARSPLRRDLRLITAEGAAFCVMAAAAQEFFQPFVLALGHSQTSAGLMFVVPIVVASLIQSVAPSGLKWMGSVRRWSVLTVCIQAASLLLLVAAAARGQMPLVPLFLAASLYYAGSYANSPAWNTWMETVIPRSVRPKFMARRLVVCYSVQGLAMLGAGYWLSLGRSAGHEMATFASLFVLACVARFAGAWFLSCQSEPVPLPADYRVLGFKDSLRCVLESRDARLLIYLLGAQVALHIGSPFLAPYVLAHLKFSYTSFAVLLAVFWLARIVALQALGSMARRMGPRRMFWIAGIGLVPISVLWLLCPTYPALLAIQAVNGVLMGIYELGVAMVYLEAIPARDRTSVLSRFNVPQAMAMLAGGLLGGALLKSLGEGTLAYGVIFTLCAVARVGALGMLARATRLPACAPPVPAAHNPDVHRALAQLARRREMIRNRVTGGPLAGRPRTARPRVGSVARRAHPDRPSGLPKE